MLAVALAPRRLVVGQRPPRRPRPEPAPPSGRHCRARYSSPSPARRAARGSTCACRPRCDASADEIREPVLLRLPPGRSPPQGAILDLIGEIRLPRGPKNGFDERTWLRRHGVHVVVRATGGESSGDEAGCRASRTGCARSCPRDGSGLHGERRAVIAGIVLGEDEGLSDELRANFRASGLYHLLAVSGQNVALIAGGVILLVVSDRTVALRRTRSSRSRRSVGTCSQSAGSRLSCGRESQGRSPRWRGLPRGRVIAGTSCCSARPCCWPGVRTRSWTPASSSRSRPSGRSSSSSLASSRPSPGTRCLTRSPRSSRSPARAGSQRRRSCSRSSESFRSTRSRRTRSLLRSSPRSSGSRSSRRSWLRSRRRWLPCSHGSTGGWPHTSRCARGWSAGCRMRPFPLVLRSRSPRSSSAPPISSLGSVARGGGRTRRSPWLQLSSREAGVSTDRRRRRLRPACASRSWTSARETER